MRGNYWSNSKFADWVRGTPKLKWGTMKEWGQWKIDAKNNHPIRFWLVEEGFNKLQNFVNAPIDFLYDIKYHLLNRFKTKTHALTSNLKRGQWYEFDTRMINCLFDELVNFVEIDQAWCNIAWSVDARKKYNSPWNATGWFRLRTWRSSEAGRDYLLWASNLKCDESMGMSPNDEGYGEPTSQAVAALEIFALYNWWKHERPTRPDPYDVSGWSKICDARREKYDDLWLDADETKKEKAETKVSLEKVRELEEKYEKEDEEMLIRLVKIRHSLWT